MDPSEFEGLYRREWDELMARARSLVDDPDEAEDLVQEAVLVCVERVRRGREVTNARAFLLGCLRRLARNKRVRLRRRARLVAASNPPRTAPAHAEWVEARDLCERILRELPASDARLLRMRYLEGLTTRMMVDRLGSTRGAVRNRLYRARARARNVVTKLGNQAFVDQRGPPQSDGTGDS
ncbi:MAG: RNA polymerase sigma factor [bacterium]